MIYIPNADFETFEHLYKINLVNCCSGYKSANLLGSKSVRGVENLAVFSSVTHIGSDPALLGFFCRPTSVARNTYDNIKDTGFYTINHIHAGILKDAHHTSAKYDAEISEFDKTDLLSEYKNEFHAPFVKSAPLQLAMQLEAEYPIKENGTILVIGQIKGIYVQEGLLKADGFINLSEGKVSAINGLDAYAVADSSVRFEYQRPK
ncbi:flavin oxidoreductase [Subsaximicrobium wynnwilliamsii]|uniref:Flavin oxidoreductase n=1 Tax=Subsaximicrobium wynnwilliamsii TaxID=291179 RepID=A0A5C6ZF00_9FLAO|nr:flavin reductase [Subsaximicrobium wynnwilliamsii]TXD81314.1 flavin oxidoreductase [Subsaximicrobium wynnwilliamsii]TXD87317.1 flavin oxidoreductase [Subsaximicrobium wynnwilliamsii]TXE00922.1 flavin oxidoreductase [Subsaximicrobium wynnwilliamsii]